MNTSNVIDMNCLFYNYFSLLFLPDISKWNINNVIAINDLFYGCTSLTILPDISK